MAINDPTTKTCTRCKETKSIGEYYRDKRRGGRPIGHCKTCHSGFSKRWREDNPGRAKANHAAWYRANREAELVKAKLWAQANPDKVRETKRRYARNNPEARRATVQRWRAKTRAARRLWSRQYYALNTEKMIVRAAARRALVRSFPGDGWTPEDVAAVHKAQRGRCAYCRCKLGEKFERDHILALARGGRHDRFNLQLTCTFCNRSKGARHPMDHARSLGLLL